MNIKSFALLFPLFLLANLPLTYAADDLFAGIQNGIASNLGIGTFASGLLCSVVLLSVVMFPIFILSLGTKGNTPMIFMLIIGLVIMGFEVAIAWLPAWLFVLLVLLVALMYGKKMADVL